MFDLIALAVEALMISETKALGILRVGPDLLVFVGGRGRGVWVSSESGAKITSGSCPWE